MSPVLYMSLERFRSAPINHFILCPVHESRTSVKRTENKVKQKRVNIRGYPRISPGRFVHCQYRNQSVSTPCMCEKQSVSVTPLHPLPPDPHTHPTRAPDHGTPATIQHHQHLPTTYMNNESPSRDDSASPALTYPEQ